MNRFERRNRAIEKEIREEIEKYKAIYRKADEEDRDPTNDERLDIESHLKAIEVLKEEKEGVEANIKTLQGVDETLRELGPAVSPLDSVRVGDEPHDRFVRMANANVFPQAQKTIGEQFIDSKQYQTMVKEYKETGRLRENFSTGPVKLEAKGTLLEGAGAPGAGSGGGAIAVPQVVPGVVTTLFQSLHVSDLILEGQTNTNTLRYIVEGTATSGAAGVAEGGAKPESVLGLGTKDEPVKKIATLLPVSEEMVEDAPAIQSYINGRLTLFVRIEEERQLIRGTSGGNEVQGILTSRNVPVYAGGSAVGDYAVQLLTAMNGQRGSAFVEPDWIILHPTDWTKLRLLKDNQGQYYGGGPFLGTYGNAGPVTPSPQLQGPQDTVWNKLVYVTAALGGAGTALVGSRESAQIFRRGGISVEATNSHSTYFANNLLAIRAEERLALAVYRPSGFTEVRLS